MCETAKAVIQHRCGLGVESRALVLEPQALLVLPVLQPRLYSRRREFHEGITGPLRRPGDAGGSRTHLQKLSDPDSQCLVSITTVWCPPIVRSPSSLWGLHPHCALSIPILGPLSPLWGLHPHCGVFIPHCVLSIPTLGPLPTVGVSIHTVGSPSSIVGVFIPFLGSSLLFWGLHLHCVVFIPFMGSPPPIPGTPYLSPGFPMPGASSVTHVDSWARCGAAQEGFVFTFLPQRLPSAFRTLIGDWSLPLCSLPRVQLCPARPGWVAL